MQVLTTTFETLRMQDSKTIGEFYAKLCDVSNKEFALEEKSSEITVSSIKVIDIEEAKDLEIMKIDELIRSLQTFEMNLD